MERVPRFTDDIVSAIRLVLRHKSLFLISFLPLLIVFGSVILVTPPEYQTSFVVTLARVGVLENGLTPQWKSMPLTNGEATRAFLQREFPVADRRSCRTGGACLQGVLLNPSDPQVVTVSVLGSGSEQVKVLAAKVQERLSKYHLESVERYRQQFKARMQRLEGFLAESETGYRDFEKNLKAAGKGAPEATATSLVARFYWRMNHVEPAALELEGLKVGLAEAFVETRFSDYDITQVASRSLAAKALFSLVAVFLSALISAGIIGLWQWLKQIRVLLAINERTTT